MKFNIIKWFTLKVLSNNKDVSTDTILYRFKSLRNTTLEDKTQIQD